MGRRMVTLEAPGTSERALADGIKTIAHPLSEGDLNGYDPLLQLIGDARIVLLGEASHGTHEFYRERARITTRLVEELGFTFVAVEGDWPEAYRVNQYVRGGPGDARDALSVFTVFPTWMWGNRDTLHFVEWLRRFNDSREAGVPKVGFYGLDLYSLYTSMQAVIAYLDKVDPQAAGVARQRYGCFEPFSGSKDLYAYSTGLGLAQSCEDEAIAILQDLRSRREQYLEISPDDSYFNATQSAAVARDGERYYRSMYRSDEISWNLRDVHMVNTLGALLEHFGPDSRAVVWEHNTHIGDFRATADADGMVNAGQLVRERYPGQSIAVGFGTYEGTVTAATAWGESPRLMQVPSARSGSYDDVFHRTDMERLLVLLKPLQEARKADGLDEWRGQRAIGVVYHPQHEAGNYVPSRLATRYDAYIHIDRTKAVRPLRLKQETPPAGSWDEETYPTGY